MEQDDLLSNAQDDLTSPVSGEYVRRGARALSKFVNIEHVVLCGGEGHINGSWHANDEYAKKSGYISKCYLESILQSPFNPQSNYLQLPDFVYEVIDLLAAARTAPTSITFTQGMQIEPGGDGSTLSGLTSGMDVTRLRDLDIYLATAHGKTDHHERRFFHDALDNSPLPSLLTASQNSIEKLVWDHEAICDTAAGAMPELWQCSFPRLKTFDFDWFADLGREDWGETIPQFLIKHALLEEIVLDTEAVVYYDNDEVDYRRVLDVIRERLLNGRLRRASLRAAAPSPSNQQEGSETITFRVEVDLDKHSDQAASVSAGRVCGQRKNFLGARGWYWAEERQHGPNGPRELVIPCLDRNCGH